MKTIVIKDRRPIPLGRVGENEATEIKFCIAAFFPGLSGALYELVHKLPNGFTYIVRDRDDGRVRDGFVNWVVKDSDLGTSAGTGVAQLTAFVNGQKYKTVVFTTQIENGLGVGPAPASPETPWVTKVFEEGERVSKSLEDAQAAAKNSELSAALAVEAAAAVPTTVDNALAAAKASGEFDGADGQDGFSPTVTVQPVAGGHEVTITDVDGDHTFIVADGEDGSGANDIFWVEPYETTLAEMETAYQTGKILMINELMYVATLGYRATDGSKYSFTATFSSLRNTSPVTGRIYVFTRQCALVDGEEQWKSWLTAFNPDEVVWAEYGETTAAEICQLFSDGCSVMCNVETDGVSHVYSLNACVNDESNPVATFISTDGANLSIITVADSGDTPVWTTETYCYPYSTSALPKMDGTAAAGTNNSRYAREDHVHPVDTSRAPAAAGMPAGGTKGYSLKKKSSTDYDVEWGPNAFDLNVITNSTTHVATSSTSPAVLMEKLNSGAVNCNVLIGNYEGILHLQGLEYLVSEGVTYWTIRFMGFVLDGQGNPGVAIVEFPDQAQSAASLVGTGYAYPFELGT